MSARAADPVYEGQLDGEDLVQLGVAAVAAKVNALDAGEKLKRVVQCVVDHHNATDEPTEADRVLWARVLEVFHP